MTACDGCLRRGYLLGLLAPRVSDLLGRRTEKSRGLLALDDERLIDAICGPGDRSDAARAFVHGFDPGVARGALAAADVAAVCRHGASYPEDLSMLADAPPVLFVAGDLARLDALVAEPAVTIVGTREPSPYGIEMARSLGRGLAAAGVTVVSGLALGIDAAAHLGACAADARVALAVIARGPEAPYPRRHADLYRRIRASGCVVSELPPGTGVYRWAFPARNRIMAALAEVTVVVEAADPSGSLITASFAADLGRDVAAVPGRVTSSAAQGSNRLLRDGAHVVLDTGSVIDVLAGMGRPPRNRAATFTDASELEPELDPPLQAVLAALERCEAHHQLAAEAGLEAGPLRAALGRLEVLGLIRRDELGGYVRTAA
jgi:DNA processing protein